MPEKPTVRVDAHQHFWKRELPFDYRWLEAPAHQPICRDFLPIDLEPQLRAAHVDFTVLVQTQHDLAENRWALQLAEQHAWIAGVVGWVDLAAPDCEEQLAEFQSHPRFVGVRHITQDEPDPDFIIRPEVLRGLKVLEQHQVPFDLLFFVPHLKHATTVAEAVPGLPLVIDHLSKPPIRSGWDSGWERNLRAAAHHPNLHCKLSGMVTEADWKDWTVDDLRPFVEVALDAFGPERCLFGSDWPVCELAARYTEVVQALEELLSPLSDAEQAAVWGGNAIRFYGLAVRESAEENDSGPGAVSSNGDSD